MKPVVNLLCVWIHVWHQTIGWHIGHRWKSPSLSFVFSFLFNAELWRKAVPITSRYIRSTFSKWQGAHFSGIKLPILDASLASVEMPSKLWELGWVEKRCAHPLPFIVVADLRGGVEIWKFATLFLRIWLYGGLNHQCRLLDYRYVPHK